MKRYVLLSESEDPTPSAPVPSNEILHRMAAAIIEFDRATRLNPAEVARLASIMHKIATGETDEQQEG